MPKIKKKGETEEDFAQQMVRRAILKKKMFNSSLITFIIALLCFVVSFIFNGAVYVVPNPSDSMVIKILVILIKGGLIIAAFFFLFISYANMMELRGSVMSFKHILILIIISIVQSITYDWVFLTSAVGITIVIIYLYLIQSHIRKRNLIQT